MRVTTTYLAMNKPEQLRLASPPGGFTIATCIGGPQGAIRADFARYLYGLIGGPWTWTDRLSWTQNQWQEELDQPGAALIVASQKGQPVGYVHLQNNRDEMHFGPETTPERPHVEVLYFGLENRVHGRGLGKALLGAATQIAWQNGAGKVWVHTCNLDGPAAIPTYKSRGFVPYRETTTDMEYPEKPLGVWKSLYG